MSMHDPSFATSGTLIQKHEGRITELINSQMVYYMRTLDPVTQDMALTSHGVKSDGIGRDMRILKTFKGGMSGRIEGGTGRTDPTLYGDMTASLGSKLYRDNAISSSTQVFPSALSGPKPHAYRLGIGLESCLCSLAMSIGDLVLEGLPATIGSHIADIYDGWAMNMARFMCNSWWMDQSKNRRLCKISSFASVDANTFTFKPDNQAIGRFEVGQMIDIFVSDFTARKNDTAAAASQTVETMVPVYVAAVDGYENKVTCYSAVAHASFKDGAGGTASPANGDLVLPTNIVSGLGGTELARTFAGFYSWAKKGGADANDKYLLGDCRDTNNQIDVDTHPEFKSFFYDVGGAALTEDLLTQLLQRFHAVNRPLGFSIDMLAAPTGVWQAYRQQLIGQFTLDRTGKVSSMAAQGNDGRFEITVDGSTYSGFETDWMESGELVGLKSKGNWSAYVPPKHPGASSLAKVPTGVPFQMLTSLMTGTDRAPVLQSVGSSGEARMTTYTQVFGDIRMQRVPEQTASMVLTNCLDSRLYSNV